MADSLESLRRALADRYTLEREIGRGGNAVVYLAMDAKHDRKVAVKVLSREMALSVRTERFFREIQLGRTVVPRGSVVRRKSLRPYPSQPAIQATVGQGRIGKKLNRCRSGQARLTFLRSSQPVDDTAQREAMTR